MWCYNVIESWCALLVGYECTGYGYVHMYIIIINCFDDVPIVGCY